MAMVASRVATMHPRKSPKSTAAATFIVALSLSAAALGSDYRVIARTGSPTPFGPGVSYQQFLANGSDLPRPRLAHQGALCFYSVLSGPAVTNSDRLAVLRTRSGSTNSVWRQGQEAPGLQQGVQFTGISRLAMNAFGDISYISSLTGPGVLPGVNDRGVWLATSASGGQGAGPSIITREGTAVTLSGIPAASMRWLSGADVANPGPIGPVVVTGDIDIPGVGDGLEGIIVQTPAGLELAMVANTQLPGAEPGTLVFLTTPVIGPGGIGAYQCTLAGPGVGQVVVNGITITTDKALVAGYGQQLQTLARSGMQAETEPPGVAFWTVWGGSTRSALSRTGDIVFSANLAGPGVTTANWWGLWKHTAGRLSRVARLGEASPVSGSTLGGFTLFSGANILSMTDASSVVFSAYLTGGSVTTSDNGVIIHDTGTSRQIVARAGVATPVLPFGTRLLNSTFGTGARVGPAGHVAIAAKLEGSGVVSANDVVVLLWSPDGGGALELVCREGDVIGDHRITNLSHTAPDLQVNARGQIVFTATVVRTDDSMQTPRTAILAAAPGQPVRIVAVEGGSIPDGDQTLALRTVRMSASSALNDEGRVAFVAAVGPGATLDEAVIDAVAVTVPCLADRDRSGIVEVADIFAFLSDWFRGDADFDHNGQTEVPDIFSFLGAWFHGCPA